MTVLDLTGGQRQSGFAYRLLDKALEFVADLVPLNDGSTPSISNDTDRTVKRQLSGLTLDPRQLGDINPLEQRLAVSMVTDDGEYPLGVFLFSSYDRKRSTRGEFPSPTLSDQCVILDQPSDTTLSIAPGTLVTDAIRARVAAFGVPFIIEMEGSTARTGSAPMSWPGGTSRLTIINELAAVAGFYSAHFDNLGRLVFKRPTTVIEPVDADLVYDLDGTSRVIAESIVVSDSLIDAPNRYVVRDTSATDSPIFGSYDVPAAAPHSAANRGYVVAVNLDRQGIGTKAQADAAARAAALSGTVYEWLGFASAPDPRHDTFQTVAFDGIVYRETGWSMTLRDGEPMTHDLRRTYE